MADMDIGRTSTEVRLKGFIGGGAASGGASDEVVKRWQETLAKHGKETELGGDLHVDVPRKQTAEFRNHCSPSKTFRCCCNNTALAAGWASFPKDLSHPPREWAERSYNVQRWTQMPSGGHFAALEEPELLVEDIRAFFRTLR